MEETLLQRICRLLGEKPEKFKKPEPPAPPTVLPESKKEEAPYQESLNIIADGFVSVIKMMTEMKETLKNISADLMTVKDENFSFIQGTKTYRQGIKKDVEAIKTATKYGGGAQK